MTYEEWFKLVVEELRANGFKVGVYAGFPLILEPLTIFQRIKALDLQLKVPVEKRIYGGGMLLIPRELHEQT